MIAYGARKVTELLLKEKVIEKEYEEVYQYGTELLLSTALDFLIVLIMGAIFGRTEAGILYFLVLATVRMSDGKLMETQTANYFSDIYPIDCAVLSANAQSCQKCCTLLSVLFCA